MRSIKKDIQRGKDSIVYSNRFFNVKHTCVDFVNHKKDYYVVEFGARVGVLLIKDDMVLLVKQYRFLIDDYSLELPGGSVDQGENIEEALSRECLEETGIYCEQLRKLVRYYPGLDNVQNQTTIFYTSTFHEVGKHVPNNKEVEGLFWITIKECVDMIKEGKILDAMTIVGILSYCGMTTNKKTIRI
jgi:ADP-ribose pyrophosphatase